MFIRKKTVIYPLVEVIDEIIGGQELKSVRYESSLVVY
jgi:hypothetical protein